MFRPFILLVVASFPISVMTTLVCHGYPKCRSEVQQKILHYLKRSVKKNGKIRHHSRLLDVLSANAILPHHDKRSLQNNGEHVHKRQVERVPLPRHDWLQKNGNRHAQKFEDRLPHHNWRHGNGKAHKRQIQNRGLSHHNQLQKHGASEVRHASKRSKRHGNDKPHKH